MSLRLPTARKYRNRVAMRSHVPFLVLILLTSLQPVAATAAQTASAGRPAGTGNDAAVAEVPTLGVGLDRIPGGAWRLNLAVTGLKLTAADAGSGANTVGQGHAVLIVDGRQKVDLFSPTHDLGALKPGTHEIDVFLATNGGEAYLHDHRRIEKRLFLLVPDSDTEMFSKPKTFDLPLVQGKLAPSAPTIRIEQGDTVALNWAGDQAMELHLHGYDLKAQVAANSTATMLFKATLAGRFNVEKHGKNEYVLLYVEVYPK